MTRWQGTMMAMGFAVVGHPHRAAGFWIAHLRRNLSVASGLPVGDFPQRRPDLLLKGRALHPQREVKRLPLPRKVFGKLLLCLPEQRRLLLGL